jgi:hypothetical protein
MTCNDASGRVATGTRDSVVQVWSFDSNEGLRPLFSVQLSTTVPRTLGFVDNTAQDLYVFGLYNGNWYA